MYTGNNIKSMNISVDASLKKLRTSYIDILYVHWWDWDTSVEEVMNGLHVLVQQGKVLYLVSVLFYSYLPQLLMCIGGREFRTPLHGLFPKQTSMLVITENLRL